MPQCFEMDKNIKSNLHQDSILGEKGMCVFVHIWKNVKKYTRQTIKIIYFWWDKFEVQKAGRNCQYRWFSGLTSYTELLDF